VLCGGAGWFLLVLCAECDLEACLFGMLGSVHVEFMPAAGIPPVTLLVRCVGFIPKAPE